MEFVIWVETPTLSARECAVNNLGNSRRRWRILLLLRVGLLMLAGSMPALSAPTGNTPWAIVLCKFTDQNYLPLTNGEPQTTAWLSNFFTESGKGTGGLFDYWAQASLDQISLSGTRLFGWYKLPPTDVLTNYSQHRADVWNVCVDAARSQGADFSKFYGILVVPNQQTDDGALGIGKVVIGPANLNVNYPAHEMGHGYGLDHSYDTQLKVCSGVPGEYGDDYDIMSWTCSVKAGQGYYGSTGPGLSAAYLNLIGWMPVARVYAYNPSGPAKEITLAALDSPQDSQYLMVKIPIGTDPLHYYTVEFRHNRGLDSGLNDKIVLIHEVRQEHQGSEYLQYHPFLVDSNPDNNAALSPEWIGPVPSFVSLLNDVHVTVVSTGENATVNLGHANDGPAPYFPPRPPNNLREGRTGISTLAYPGFIDIMWDESDSGVTKFQVLLTGTLNQTILTTSQTDVGSGQAMHYASQQIEQGSVWTFQVRACWHGDVCSLWSAQLTVTNPLGGGSAGGGSSGGLGGRGGGLCRTPGNLPCFVICGGRHNPCPLPSKQ